MATSPSENLIRTTDLTLATYLTMEGLTPEMETRDVELKAGHPQGAWVFPGTQTVRDLVHDYTNGEALVEPRDFQATLNKVRREMFQHLGIGQG